MGFRNRLKLVRDESAPIERRVSALCDALSHSHLGFSMGQAKLTEKFGIEIGKPIHSESLIQAAEYLENEWEKLRNAKGTITR